MRSRYVTIHYLYSLAAMCANRDDLHCQKVLETLNGLHARISSQSARFAWRVSDYFARENGHMVSHRSRILGVELYKSLCGAGMGEKKARDTARKVASYFGELGKEKDREKMGEDIDLTHKNAIHYSVQEIENVKKIATEIAKTGNLPEKKDVVLFSHKHKNIDIALWGRCLTDKDEGVGASSDAACSVSHEISVHTVNLENDYFTTVDTLNKKHGKAGAAYVGNNTLAHGVFYGCVTVDRYRLVENLCGDEELADQVLKALLQSVALVRAGGMKTSTNPQAGAEYICAVTSNANPVNHAGIFIESPICSAESVLDAAVQRIREQIDNLQYAYDLDPIFDNVSEMYIAEKLGRLSDVYRAMVS